MIMQQYTVKRGYYRKRELSLLATSLGFPGTLLVNRFHTHYVEGEDGADNKDGKAVSEKMIARLLSSGVLFKRLEKVFNKYPAWYNVKLIRKAMQHIRHRTLGFSDVSECRMAFELYAYDDGSGIPAELSHVLQALKMLERIMSPSQLQMEIQRFSEVSDVPSRLQLYEFMDIVAICGKTDAEEERRLETASESQVASESSHELSVPDFGQILMTTDQKVSAYLESNYQQSLHGRRESPAVPLDTDRIVHTELRKSLVSLAAEQSRAVTPCLEHSQSQLHRSRGGFYTLSEEHFKSVHTSRQPSPIRSKSSKALSKRHCIFSAEDPLKKGTENSNSVIKNPVRVRLHHLSLRKTPPIPTDKAKCNPASETLRKTINDICADSVIKARGTLHAMSAISPPNTTQPLSHQISQSPETMQTSSLSAQRHTSVVAAGRKPSSRGHVRFHLEPVVTKEDREEQQGLIDDLMWSTCRSKVQYNTL